LEDTEKKKKLGELGQPHPLFYAIGRAGLTEGKELDDDANNPAGELRVCLCVIFWFESV
jgi:hypothetical protein